MLEIQDSDDTYDPVMEYVVCPIFLVFADRILGCF